MLALVWSLPFAILAPLSAVAGNFTDDFYLDGLVLHCRSYCHRSLNSFLMLLLWPSWAHRRLAEAGAGINWSSAGRSGAGHGGDDLPLMGTHHCGAL